MTHSKWPRSNIFDRVTVPEAILAGALVLITLIGVYRYC